MKRAVLMDVSFGGRGRLLCKINAGSAAGARHLIYALRRAVNRNISDDVCFSSDNYINPITTRKPSLPDKSMEMAV